MHCGKCGQPIDTQTYCPNCGTPTGVVAQVAGVPLLQTSRVARHLRTLGILWVAYSIYVVLHWLLILPLLHGWLGGSGVWIDGSNTWIYAPFHPGGWLLHFIAIMVIARAILSLAVGIALLTRQPWGRVFAIVIAILTLIKPLLGTLLAIYTLWVLLGRNAGPDYNRMMLSNKEQPL